MRTNIYIDGYNLYYGCLRHTPYKWLDLVVLFRDHILKAQCPEAKLQKVKFFTSPARSRFSVHGADSEIYQGRYHRALQVRYPDVVEVVLGYFDDAYANLHTYKKPVDPHDRTEVWRLEEKETDVNIALSIYRDCAKDNVDQVVVVSSDSDLVPAMRAVNEDFPGQIECGLVLPVPERDWKSKKGRPGNKKLSDLSNWTRRYIRDDELAASQLPGKIPTNKKPIEKPERW